MNEGTQPPGELACLLPLVPNPDHSISNTPGCFCWDNIHRRRITVQGLKAGLRGTLVNFALRGAVGGGEVFGAGVKMQLGTPTLVLECLGSSSGSTSASRFLLMRALRGNR